VKTIGTTKMTPQRLSNFGCSNSNSPIPHLEFSLTIQSNNLTYKGNSYTKYQQFLYDLCKQLHDKGHGYRKIAKMLNKWGLKTNRGNTFFNTSISSILKRKHQRDARIEDTRHKVYPVKIGKLSINYYVL